MNAATKPQVFLIGLLVHGQGIRGGQEERGRGGDCLGWREGILAALVKLWKGSIGSLAFFFRVDKEERNGQGT